MSTTTEDLMKEARIGSLITWEDNEHTWDGRISSFVKELTPRSVYIGPEFLGLDAFDAGYRWVFCPLEEATHASCVGVCGFIAPLAKLRVCGHVSSSWSEHLVREHEDQARRLWGEYV